MVETSPAPIDVDALATLLTVRVELPSWALRGDEPRISAYQPPGSPRSPYELLADAAVVHRFTGIAGSVGLHLPADRVDDPADLAAHAAELGMRIGSVHPELSPRAGRPPTVCHPDGEVRRRALDRLYEAAAVAGATRTTRMVLRLVDDSPYPGQAEAGLRQQRLTEALGKVRAELDPSILLLVEYQTGQPCAYRQDVPDWSTAQAHCRSVGPGAQVLLDLGHDTELVALDTAAGELFADGRLGGLVVPGPVANDGALRGGETRFGIFVGLTEVVAGGALVPGQPLTTPVLLDPGIDRAPGILPLIRAVLAVQELVARAVLYAGMPREVPDPEAGDVVADPASARADASVPASDSTRADASVPRSDPGVPSGRGTGRKSGKAAEKAAARAAARAAAAAAEAAASREAAATAEALLRAYETNVEPLLGAVRGALGVPADPVESYHELCRAEHREAERRAAVQRLVARRVAVLLTPGASSRAAQPA